MFANQRSLSRTRTRRQRTAGGLVVKEAEEEEVGALRSVALV